MPQDFEDALAAGDRLARELCQGLPKATNLLREHEEDHDEILATLFLNDVGDWYTEAWLARDTDPASFHEVQQLVARIAERYTEANDTEQTMIVTGFVEALPNAGEHGRGVIAELPNVLRQERERMDSPRS
jgi:hypothetical protein